MAPLGSGKIREENPGGRKPRKLKTGHANAPHFPQKEYKSGG